MQRSLALLLLAAGILPAQEKTAIQTAGEEVLVDVVVRDKKGHAITSLPQSAFTVTDEGAPRPISAFRLIKGTEAFSTSTAGGATATPQRLDPLRQIRLVTLIFDRLDQGERFATRRAAQDLLQTDLPPNVYMAVFTLGNELQAVQGFTNRRDSLVSAIEKATSRPSSQFASDSNNLRAQAEQILGPNQTGNQDLVSRLYQLAGNAGAGASPSGGVGGAGAVMVGMDAIMARSLVEMISFSERSEMSYEGRSTIWALLAAVRGQTQLPGRKAIIYFSEGFAIPQGAEEEFQAVISTANRNNLSFYPIDAHGLSGTSLNQKATEGLSAAAATSAANPTLISNGLAHLTTPVTEIALSADLAINANRMNTQDTLAILADQTGGFLTANTNDFRAPLQRVMEEVDTYYEIAYNPQIDKYDGKFRHIGVKLNRSDLTVQSRAGYFALPPDMLKASGMNAYEVPLLRALSDMVPNRSLPFESGGIHFRSDGRLETCGFLIDMPLTNVSLSKMAGKESLKGGLAYVALIKNAKGAVEKKLQGEMPVELEPGQVPSFKEGRFTDMEYFDVAPGYYTIEVAVLDRETGRTSARSSAMYVPKQGGGLAMSSVSLIRKWRPKEPDAAPDDPFIFEDKTVTPTLVTRINKSVSTSLPFYLIVYPNPTNAGKPELLIEFNRDANVKRVAAVTLGEPDSTGRIQYVANAPINQFEPGNYAVRFVVRQGAETVEENFAIDLEP
jgi:VWFA-related protein